MSDRPAKLEPDDAPTKPAERGRIRPFPALAPGLTLGRYRLVRLLGRGGFGAVWDAEDALSGRRVALKVLTLLHGSEEAVRRFEREGRLAASLDHPRCVFVFAAEEIEGYPTIAMERMPGGTLQDLLEREGRIPPSRAVDLVLDVLEGLEAAHRHGILHRDVKPSNCFLDEGGRVRIGDFGISKSLEPGGVLTAEGAFVGTPVFAPPEQLRGREVDLRSDLYSVGALLYTLLAGQVPFPGSHLAEVVARIVTEAPPPLQDSVPVLPRGLEGVVLRLLAKDPAKRYRSHAAARRALVPFSSRGLPPAWLGRRVGAMAIDLCGFMLLGLLAAPLVLRVRVSSEVALGWVPTLLLWSYFVVTESVWGASLGKRSLGLRVTDALGAAPSVARVMIRTTVFLGILEGLSVLDATGFLGYVGYLVLAVTMRRANGFAALHEWLSGTRVRGLPDASLLAMTPGHDRQEPDGLVPGLRFGPFQAGGTVWDTGAESLVRGWDETLRRAVWIRRFDTSHAPSPREPSLLSTPGSVRWLQGSRDAQGGWDAYDIPDGTAFLELVGSRGALSWEQLRILLESLLAELKTRRAAGSPEPRVSLRHLWVDESGGIRIGDFFLTPSPSRPGAEPLSEVLDSRRLIRRFVRVGLLGTASVRAGGDDDLPDIPLPEHARGALLALFDLAEDSAFPGSASAALEASRGRPAAVTRLRRVATLAAVAFYPVAIGVVGIGDVLLASRMPPAARDFHAAVMVVRYGRQEWRREPDDEHRRLDDALRTVIAASYDEAVATLHGKMSLDRLDERSRAFVESARRRQAPHSADEVAQARQLVLMASRRGLTAGYVRFALSWICIVAITEAFFALMFSILFRGGLVIRLFGLRMQDARGRPASRARCLLRAAAAWSPFLLLLAVEPPLRENFAAGQRLAIPAFLVVVAALGTILAVLRPERAIQDRIAGTVLVPR